MPQDNFADLDLLVPTVLAENVTPGAAVAAFDREGELFCRGYGWRDASGRLAVDGDTRFAYASISKTMTALVTGSVVQDGLLAWDTRVCSILPDFQLADPLAGERCTLRDLFLHRSGLPGCDLIFWRRNIPLEDVLKIVAVTPHAHEFRNAFQYQNLHFGVITLMLLAVTGRDWHTLMRERLFEPLGLISMATTISGLTRDDHYARPCGPNGFTPYREQPFMEMYGLAAAGAVSGSVRDLARYGQMMLRNGAGLIPAEVIAECTRPQVLLQAEAWPELLFYGQGLGWLTQVYRGEICWSGAGGMDGYTSHIYVLPKRGVTAAALCNRTSAATAQMLALEVLDRAAGFEPLKGGAGMVAAFYRPEARFPVGSSAAPICQTGTLGENEFSAAGRLCRQVFKPGFWRAGCSPGRTCSIVGRVLLLCRACAAVWRERFWPV